MISKAKKIGDIKMWLVDDTRCELSTDEKGRKVYPRKNVEYLHRLSDCEIELGKIGIICWFLKTRLDIKYAWTMMSSAKKQRMLVNSVLYQLKTFKLREKDLKAFEHDTKAIENRVIHLRKMIKEDIRLSKYHLYFTEFGYDVLDEIELPTAEDMLVADNGTSTIDYLYEEAEKYNTEHIAEVEAHMSEVQKELDIRDKHRDEVKAKEKAKKKAIKEAKKAENAYIREMQANKAKHIARERKIDKEIMINAGWANRDSYNRKYGNDRLV